MTKSESQYKQDYRSMLSTYFLVIWYCFKIGNKLFSVILVNVSALLYLRNLFSIKLYPHNLKMYLFQVTVLKTCIKRWVLSSLSVLSRKLMFWMNSELDGCISWLPLNSIYSCTFSTSLMEQRKTLFDFLMSKNSKCSWAQLHQGVWRDAPCLATMEAYKKSMVFTLKF